MRVVVILPSTRTCLKGIKQLSELKQRGTIDYWVLGSPDIGANDFVEHPGRDTPSRVVGKSHIDDVALTASATENLKLLTEQRMMGIENFCGFR